MEYRENGVIAVIESSADGATVTVTGGDVVELSQMEELFDSLALENIHLIIDGEVKEIGEEAFSGFDFIKSVKIGKGVRVIGAGAFGWCRSVSRFEVDEENEWYCSREAHLYTKSADTLVQCALGNGEEALTLPCGVRTIGRSAVSSHPTLKKADLSGVLRIEDSAFSCCEQLCSVELGSVAYVGNHAFCGCTALKEINLPAQGCLVCEDAFALSGLEKC